MTVKIIKHGTEGFPREAVRTVFWNNLYLRQKLNWKIDFGRAERKILVVKAFQEKYFGISFMLLIFELIFSRCLSFCHWICLFLRPLECSMKYKRWDCVNLGQSWYRQTGMSLSLSRNIGAMGEGRNCGLTTILANPAIIANPWGEMV